MGCIFLITFWVLTGGCTSNSQTQSPIQQAQPALTPQVTGSEVTSISKTIKKIIANQLDLDPKDVQMEVALSKQKKPADDLDVVEIILTIEEKYKIELKDEEVGETLEKVRNELTVAKLVKLVAQKTKLVR